MKIEFAVDKRDFLTYQLYAASKSGKMKKIRSRLTYMIAIIYICLGILFLAKNNPKVSLVFFGIAILWYLLIPVYIRKRILGNYSKYIDAHYSKRYGMKTTFTFGDEFIESTSSMGDSKFKISEMTALEEINDYYYLRFSSGVAVIIPKRKIKDLPDLQVKLDQIVVKQKITPIVNLDWKWK